MDVECYMPDSDRCILTVYRNEIKYQKVLFEHMFLSSFFGFQEIPKIIRCQKIGFGISSFHTLKYDGICDKMILTIILVSSKTLWKKKSVETMTFYLTKVDEYIDLLRQVNELKLGMAKIEKCNNESRTVLHDARKLLASMRAQNRYSKSEQSGSKKSGKYGRHILDISTRKCM